MQPPTPGAVPTLLALAIPFAFAVAAALVSRGRPFRAATVASVAAVALAVGFTVGTLLHPSESGGFLGGLLQLDGVTSVMLLLVCLLGAVVVRYSRSYLSGEPRLVRYERALLVALSSVTLLTSSRNLVVIVLAWTATSLALHLLLTFYDERAQALVAAHKKFLASRAADACLVMALFLTHHATGTLDLQELARWLETHRAALPVSLQLGALLFAAGAVLRTAQLPFHGWLLQVMEAPTPVSALLHAGVVNLGGLVLIRLAPLVERAAVAQLFLVTVGTVTAVVACLVMTTRVSIKVALAWSTCAQMGFLLLECGLCAWPLALLHLVAHSLYKAHAFLGAGSVVESWRARTRSSTPAAPTLVALGSTTLALLGGAAAVWALLRAHGEAPDPMHSAAGVLLAASLAPFVARALRHGLVGATYAGVGAASVVGVSYGSHLAAAAVIAPGTASASHLGLAIAAAGFTALLAVQLVLTARPQGAFAFRVQPELFAGLHLDEWATRWSFRLWPLRRALRPTTESRVSRAALEIS